MNDKFNIGDLVYDDAGSALELVAKVPEGHIVRNVFEPEENDREPLFGNPYFTAMKLWSDPPTEKRHREIADLDETIRQRRSELGDLTLAIREAQAERKRLVSILSQNKALARIEDFVEGRMTHFAMGESWSKWGVFTKEQMLAKGDGNDSCRNESTKLLCLFGDSKGDLQWKVNEYRDGSGNWTKVVPCSSAEEAQAALQEMYEQSLRDRADKKYNTLYPICAEKAKAIGIVVPKEIEQAEIEDERQSAEATLKESSEKVEAALKRLEKANERMLNIEVAAQ